MYPAPFEYHSPTSVDEAVALLAQYRDEAKLLAGGHSLIPLMKLRFAQPAHVIDVRRIPGLSGIREESGTIVIGATTTHHALEQSELLRRRLPILAEAAAHIGDPLVRNMGTIGGSLAHADPAADLPPVMLALGAEMRAVGPNGSRSIRAEEFFVSLLTTALEPGEVLTEIRVPLPPERTGGAYEKRPHPASRFAVVGVAALLTIDGPGAITRARVGVTGIGAVASRASGVEQALAGREADQNILEEAARRVTEGIDMRADLQGPPEYKARLAAVYARRALVRALELARRA